ncbi:MAG: 4-(cytidine 5'-diphospho)-2-C-methyl-D-erythritol kinase [Bacilli bacterium]|nr:4-(cytidine 5'-diphospho)-2-C-methyl-D-erythritol kinase [Bacilli bacterium]MDY6392301.1 4-(cytidine 5'-diphospho)-2-C-methyl-D-erythritol kinase [Bacilli bacterium]
MVIKSPAKINLALQILGTREDGYHLLRMVNLPLELHDVIEIETLPYYNDTYVTCDELRLLSLRSNLCTRAVDAMRERFGFKNHFMIHIHKEIPFAAGLGGGSSNAAVVILAINKILKLGLSLDELCEIALPLGSDIPFFIRGHAALAEGIGDKLTPINPKHKYFCLLVKPEQGLSTKDVYKNCDSFPRLPIDIDKVVEGLESGDEEMIAANFGNDLYPASCSLLPQVKSIVEMLRHDGFPIAAMSGSGSCCFALTLDAKKAKAEQKKLEKLGYDAIFTKTN